MLLLAASPAFAQRDLTDIPEPDPVAERAAFTVPEGWEVNLFAADPDIAKPIQSNWDARGRLWVATSRVYPQLEPGEVADDQIVILEDTDGDGASDKTTVFADGLLIPTGVLPDADGKGAYVANSTELLYLRDENGDGRADRDAPGEWTVVLDGFGTEDT
ncbi:MAG: sorbosone dehydrogenase, partial [Planctomycetota bacterium]